MDVAQYTFKGSDNFKKMLKHYDRKWTIKKKDGIDKSRSGLNKVYGDVKINFMDKIKELQKISVKEHKFKRNTVVLGDWCLQCPPEIEGNQPEMDRFFQLATEFAKKRYSKYGFLVKTFTHFDEVNDKGQLSRSHAHLSFIPYGTFIDNKRVNINDPKHKRSDPVQKTGFCYGYIFSKKELVSFQKELEEELSKAFNNSITFGKGNSIKDEDGKNMNVKKLMEVQRKALNKANRINQQYEDIITTHNELFTKKYENNKEVLADYKATYYKAVEEVSKKTPIKSVFTRIKDFFVRLLVKKENKLNDLVKKHNQEINKQHTQGVK